MGEMSQQFFFHLPAATCSGIFPEKDFPKRKAVESSSHPFLIVFERIGVLCMVGNHLSSVLVDGFSIPS